MSHVQHCVSSHIPAYDVIRLGCLHWMASPVMRVVQLPWLLAITTRITAFLVLVEEDQLRLYPESVSPFRCLCNKEAYTAGTHEPFLSLDSCSLFIALCQACLAALAALFRLQLCSAHIKQPLALLY